MIHGVDIKKGALISGVGISFLFVCIYINIIIPAYNDLSIELSALAYGADVKTAGDQGQQKLPEIPAFDRRLDVYGFIVGVLLTSLGIVAIVLSYLRWNTKDLLLISFGVFCLFWGARTNVFSFLIAIKQELETARQIQSFILPKERAKIEGLEVAVCYIPMATMAGDFYDFLRVDEKRLGILVADVSGHGVAASLIASMVKIAFVSQGSYASKPAQVLEGINRILCGKLESDFVTAAYLYIDTDRQTAAFDDDLTLVVVDFESGDKS